MAVRQRETLGFLWSIDRLTNGTVYSRGFCISDNWRGEGADWQSHGSVASFSPDMTAMAYDLKCMPKNLGS